MVDNFNPDAYLAANSSSSDDFDPDSYIAANEPSYFEKTASNVLPDLKQMVQGAGNAAEKWAPFIGGDTASVLPGLVKQGSEMLSHPQQSAESAIRPIAHPADYFQEHPVQQTLNALGAGALAAKGVGALADNIPTTENIVPSVERVANNQTLKSLGGTMGQLGQMEKGQGGREALDAAAKYARDNGLTDVLSTQIGREKLLEGLKETSGKTIGRLREEAGPAPKGIIDKIVASQKIDKYLGDGSASSELGGVDKALADIKEIGGENPTHSSLAKAATYINKNAAGTKMYQPANAQTDVANLLSRENNAGIAQSLGSDKAKEYLEALSDQEKLNPLEHLQERGELRMAGGRGGLGTRVVQAIADRFGYRLTAKAAAAIHDALTGESLDQNLAKSAIPTVSNTTNPEDISKAVNEYIKRERAAKD